MSRKVLGLDIGGANLKAAHSDGSAFSLPFELWKSPTGLAHGLRQVVAQSPDHDILAVTMTGELCDCYPTRREGILSILAAVENVAEGRPVRIWQIDGSFADIEKTRQRPLQAAAANWLALAHFAGRYVPSGPALLIDIGSTTSDIVPLHDGVPTSRCHTDAERLQYGELVYTGVRRTPLCALLGPSYAAELFATALDVYLLLNMVPENPNDCQTADGRPATRAAAHARMARMLCADAETCSEEESHSLAVHVQDVQLNVLQRAAESVIAGLPGPPAAVVLTGSGEFLARKVVDRIPTLRVPRVSLAEILGSAVSQSACAYALAMLVRERNDG
jgi:probable H4MPT-linked C1 transfer pathway protein